MILTVLSQQVDATICQFSGKVFKNSEKEKKG